MTTSTASPLASIGPDTRAAARLRHPCQFKPPQDQLVEATAGALGRRGAPHAAIAARALVCRGRSGLSRLAFALEVGLDVAAVEALEGGWVAAADLPPALRARLGAMAA